MGTVYGEIDARRSSLFKAWRACFDGGSESAFPVAAGKAGRFSNPAAYLADECASDVLAWLADAGEEADIPASVADWCRLRAVQETDQAHALRPLLDLKQVVRDAVGAAAGDGELALVDERIDALGRYASDRYAESREKLNQIRLDEMQRGEGLMNRRLARDRARREGDAV